MNGSFNLSIKPVDTSGPFGGESFQASEGYILC